MIALVALMCASSFLSLQVATAKAELLKELEGWGDKVKAAEGAEQRVKAGSEVREGRSPGLVHCVTVHVC